jgi:hypothetical protein
MVFDIKVRSIVAVNDVDNYPPASDVRSWITDVGTYGRRVLMQIGPGYDGLDAIRGEHVLTVVEKGYFSDGGFHVSLFVGSWLSVRYS